MGARFSTSVNKVICKLSASKHKMGVTPVSALERCRNVMEGDVVRPEGFCLETMRPQYDFMY